MNLTASSDLRLRRKNNRRRKWEVHWKKKKLALASFFLKHQKIGSGTEPASGLWLTGVWPPECGTTTKLTNQLTDKSFGSLNSTTQYTTLSQINSSLFIMDCFHYMEIITSYSRSSKWPLSMIFPQQSAILFRYSAHPNVDPPTLKLLLCPT
jgi:hypothetical protein